MAERRHVKHSPKMAAKEGECFREEYMIKYREALSHIVTTDSIVFSSYNSEVFCTAALPRIQSWLTPIAIVPQGVRTNIDKPTMVCHSPSQLRKLKPDAFVVAPSATASRTVVLEVVDVVVKPELVKVDVVDVPFNSPPSLTTNMKAMIASIRAGGVDMIREIGRHSGGLRVE